jgi:hypothetical protein
MRPILNCTHQLSDTELEGIMTGALFYLVTQAGGEVVLTQKVATEIALGLTAKLVQMQIGEDITLKIITRPTELAVTGDVRDDTDQFAP